MTAILNKYPVDRTISANQTTEEVIGGGYTIQGLPRGLLELNEELRHPANSYIVPVVEELRESQKADYYDIIVAIFTHLGVGLDLECTIPELARELANELATRRAKKDSIIIH